MKCTSVIYLLTGFWLSSSGGGGGVGQASASSIDFRDSIRGGFRMSGLVVPRQAAVTNLQTFRGAVGGVAASAITDSGDPKRPFGVDGDTFPDFATAATRACDNQKNACAKEANSAQGKATGLSVGDCDKQQQQCKDVATQAAAQDPTPVATAEATFFSSNAEFDFFCE